MLRICALILCALAAASLDWTSATHSRSPSYSVQNFSLVTIRIDRSQQFALPPANALVP